MIFELSRGVWGNYSASYERLEAVLGRPGTAMSRLAGVLRRRAGVLGCLGGNFGAVLGRSCGDLGRPRRAGTAKVAAVGAQSGAPPLRRLPRIGGRI